MKTEQEDYKTKEAKRYPAPIPGVVLTIPLRLLPAYLKLHNIEPSGYLEQHEIMTVKKSESDT